MTDYSEIIRWIDMCIDDGMTYPQICSKAEEDGFIEIMIDMGGWPPISIQQLITLIHKKMIDTEAKESYPSACEKFSTSYDNDPTTIISNSKNKFPYTSPEYLFSTCKNMIFVKPGMHVLESIALAMVKYSDLGWNTFVIICENNLELYNRTIDILGNIVLQTDPDTNWIIVEQPSVGDYGTLTSNINLNNPNNRYILATKFYYKDIENLHQWFKHVKNSHESMNRVILDIRVEEYQSVVLHKTNSNNVINEILNNIIDLPTIPHTIYNMVCSSPFYAYTTSTIFQGKIDSFFRFDQSIDEFTPYNLISDANCSPSDQKIVIRNTDQEMFGFLSDEIAEIPDSLKEAVSWLLFAYLMLKDKTDNCLMLIETDGLDNVNSHIKRSIISYLSFNHVELIENVMNHSYNYDRQYIQNILGRDLQPWDVLEQLEKTPVQINILSNTFEDVGNTNQIGPIILIKHRMMLNADQQRKLVCTYHYRNLSDGDGSLHLQPWFHNDVDVCEFSRIWMSEVTNNYISNLLDAELSISDRIEGDSTTHMDDLLNEEELQFLNGTFLKINVAYRLNRQYTICDECGRIILPGEVVYRRSEPERTTRCYECHQNILKEWKQNYEKSENTYDLLIQRLLNHEILTETDIKNMSINLDSFNIYANRQGIVLNYTPYLSIGYTPKFYQFINRLSKCETTDELYWIYDEFKDVWYWSYNLIMDDVLNYNYTKCKPEYEDDYAAFEKACKKLKNTHRLAYYASEEFKYRNVTSDRCIENELFNRIRVTTYETLINEIFKEKGYVDLDDDGTLSFEGIDYNYEIYVDEDFKPFNNQLSIQICDGHIGCIYGVTFEPFEKFFNICDEFTMKRVEYICELNRRGF